MASDVEGSVLWGHCSIAAEAAEGAEGVCLSLPPGTAAATRSHLQVAPRTQLGLLPCTDDERQSFVLRDGRIELAGEHSVGGAGARALCATRQGSHAVVDVCSEQRDQPQRIRLERVEGKGEL